MFAERLPASQRLLSELAEHVHDACVCCVLVFLDRRDMSDERTTYPLSSISAASDIGRVNGYRSRSRPAFILDDRVLKACSSQSVFPCRWVTRHSSQTMEARAVTAQVS